MFLGTATPMSYQREDVEKHWQQPRIGLYNELGTGKTLTAAWIAATRWFQNHIDRVLVIGPSLVMDDWKSAFNGMAMPAHLVEVVDARDCPSGVPSLMVEPTNKLLVVLTTISSLRSLADRAACVRGGRVNVIIDEAHQAAGISGQGDAAAAFCKYAKFVTTLTATPEGRPTSLRWYGVVRLTRPDLLRLPGEGIVGKKAAIGSFTAFSSRYLTMSNNPRGPRFPVKMDQQRLNDDVLQFTKPATCVRKKKDCLDLPDKVMVLRRFDLTGAAAEAMYGLIEEDRAVIDGIDVVPDNELEHRLRCLELCGGWLAGMPVHAGKLQLLADLLESLGESFSPPSTIIWAARRLEVKGAALVAAGMSPDEALHAAVEMSDADSVSYAGRNGVGILNGMVSPAERIEINRRWVNRDYKAVVAHPQVAGAGMNWQFASATVYFGQPLGVTLRAQSEDRMHRKGRETVAMYYDLVVSGGPDEAIARAHQEQRAAAIAVLEWLREYRSVQ